MGKEVEVTIDLMKKEDVDQVLTIEQASFTMPWSRNLFLSEFRSPRVSNLLVARTGGQVGRIVGFIVFWVVEDEMHILNLAVEPGFRKQGIGRRLVRAAVRSAAGKGAKRAFLEVRVSNEAAKRLYAGLGFTGTSMRREYYDGPVEDALVMTLGEGGFRTLL